MYKGGAPINYLGVGRSALLAIITALSARLGYAGGAAPVARVLDFGCGHGRVARFLRAGFPDASIVVSDLDRAGVNWCVEQLGCMDMGAELPAESFDLIWLGSVFTHLRAEAASELLEKLKAGVRANGVLIFTSQGRFAAARAEQHLAGNAAGSYHLDAENLAAMVRQFHATGYGFASYPKTPGYGASLVKQSWYADQVVDRAFVQILAQEKGWDTHQDVQAFLRAGLLDYKKGALFAR